MSNINPVELMANQEDCAFDQPCIFGNRVEGHAVYCHNEKWFESPRKCRRTWYTGGKDPDEACTGYEPNPDFAGAHAVVVTEPKCPTCSGTRRTSGERYGSCFDCDGTGVVLAPVDLDEHLLRAVESAHSSSTHRDYVQVLVTQDSSESEAIEKSVEAGLIDIRSVSWKDNVTGYLVKLTGLGMASLRAAWKKNKQN